jgi:nicotinate-nucleotide adenylyltransferase
MNEVQRIGYLGGTFDPPHLGHQIVAREALYQLDLDRVMWLITPDPPHKGDQEITPIQFRLEMLHLVIDRYDEFYLSEVDLQRSPPFFAADTVEIITRQQPTIELVYIIGGDSLGDLPGWFEPDRFLAAIDQLAVAPRPGYDPDLAAIDRVVPGIKEKTIFLTEIMMEISSNLIRKRIKQGAAFEHFLIPEVASYIKKNQLYR